MTKFKLGLSAALVAIIGAATASAGQYYAGTYAPLRTAPAFAQNYTHTQSAPQLRTHSQPTYNVAAQNPYASYGPDMGQAQPAPSYQAAPQAYTQPQYGQRAYGQPQYNNQPAYAQPYGTQIQNASQTRSN